MSLLVWPAIWSNAICIEMAVINRQSLMDIYSQACEIELQAFKPGNVSIYSSAHDMTVEDFRISAQVSRVPITNPDFSLGEKIYHAVAATRQAVNCNTNLGIILLCAPVLQAAAGLAAGDSLRAALSRVLENTTKSDAEWVFRAIELAAPGGLGTSDAHDVRDAPNVTLLEAMDYAAERDLIAAQYVNRFKDVFDFSVLRYNRAFVLSGDFGWSALAVYAAILARFPDSHVERKYGQQYTEWIKGEMVELERALQAAFAPDKLMPVLYELDKTFKAKKINPGTTADLTVATVLVVLLEQLVSGTSG